ncbi:MAG: ATP-binding protein [Thermodesulfovibrionales bacterium]
MAFIIAYAGKGGTGKTSIAGLTVRYLMERRVGAVLAVDADSNSCLNEALGVEVHTTIGRLREDSLQSVRGGSERLGGMSVEQLLEYQVQQSVIESKGFDLIVMGRPEGPGCYCAANNILRKHLEKLSESYPYIVIDNEAGMEHLSRRITQRINLLLIMSDPSVRGIQTAKRIDKLVNELQLKIDRRALLINRTLGKEVNQLKTLAENFGLFVGGVIQYDSMISEYDLNRVPIIKLPSDSVALKSTFDILEKLRIP